MRVVVGAVLLRGGRVLAARRSYPPELAGLWELPGGGVEAGESEADALARECREELGIAIRVGGRLGPEVALGGGRVLRVHVATTDDEPTAHEHTALRWLLPAELPGLDWLPADRILLDALLDEASAAADDLGARIRRRAPS